MRILEASGNLAGKRASHPVQTQLDAPMTTTDSIAPVVLAPSGVLTEERLVVDVGANDGFLSSNSYNLVRWGWSAVLVEPNPEMLALAKKAQDP